MDSKIAGNYYETERAVSEYCLFHYGSPEQILTYSFGPALDVEFPRRCVTECLNAATLPSHAKALELGCSVGRSSFELSRCCESVRAIDSSERFIAVAEQLRRNGSMMLSVIEEGELTRPFRIFVPPDIQRDRVKFERSNAEDAMVVRLGSFDVVLMANLIDRLRNPRRCLENLPTLLNSGGQLIITSPYTWLENYTPRENWLGGFETGGKATRTFDTIQQLLSPYFELRTRKDIPFLIREHVRKYQWGVADATVWVRK